MKNEKIDDQIDLGYALSDVVKEHEDLAYTIERLGSFNVLELQPENFIWDCNSTKYLTDRISFKSIHAPSDGLDLSSDNSHLKYESILKTIDSMDLADNIGAQTLVIHPVNNMHLNPQERLIRKEFFLTTLAENIAPHYIKNNHSYSICLENIEYPKYPATLEEALTLNAEASTIMPVRMVLDIPHVWNSIRILNENPDYYKDWTHGFPIEESFEKYLRTFIEKHDDKIGIYHIAGFGTDPIRTHDPIRENTLNEEYKQLIDLIRKKPIVMEIHSPEYEHFIESYMTIRGIK